VLTNITGINHIIVSLLYGCGLRVKDIDFEYDNIYIYVSKSLKDRVIPLPLKIKTQLKEQISRVKTIHQKDL
jgi:integrase